MKSKFLHDNRGSGASDAPFMVMATVILMGLVIGVSLSVLHYWECKNTANQAEYLLNKIENGVERVSIEGAGAIRVIEGNVPGKCGGCTMEINSTENSVNVTCPECFRGGKKFDNLNIHPDSIAEIPPGVHNISIKKIKTQGGSAINISCLDC